MPTRAERKAAAAEKRAAIFDKMRDLFLSEFYRTKSIRKSVEAVDVWTRAELKRCPQDRELYQVAAVHFAKNLERACGIQENAKEEKESI